MKTTRIHLKELPSLGGGTDIEEALLVIRGVRDVQVQPEAGLVTVEHEDVDENELVQAVEATGVAAELIPAPPSDLRSPSSKLQAPPSDLCLVAALYERRTREQSRSTVADRRYSRNRFESRTDLCLPTSVF